MIHRQEYLAVDVLYLVDRLSHLCTDYRRTVYRETLVLAICTETLGTWKYLPRGSIFVFVTVVHTRP